MWKVSKSLLNFVLIHICLCFAKKPCRSSQIEIEDVQLAFYASKISYDDHLEEGQLIPYTHFQVKRIESEPYPHADSNIRVIIAEKRFTTIVAFRGTEGATQLRNELFSFVKSSPIHVTFDKTETHVSRFFWDAFKLLQPLIKDKLEDQSRKYIITGHSLGGALASLLAIYMKENGGQMWENSASSLITFGQPRVGNAAYARKHDEMIKPSRKLRFINNFDPVPHQPPWPLYEHHSREIWMTYSTLSHEKYWKICKTLDSLRCSNLWTITPNFHDHSILKYDEAILSPPKIFQDKDSKKYSRWLIALKNSCDD